MTDPRRDTATPAWDALLEKWYVEGKLRKQEYETIISLVVDEIWARERAGYWLGRAWSRHQKHGGDA